MGKVLPGKFSNLFKSNVPNYPAGRAKQSSEKPESYGHILESVTSARDKITN